MKIREARKSRPKMSACVFPILSRMSWKKVVFGLLLAWIPQTTFALRCPDALGIAGLISISFEKPLIHRNSSFEIFLSAPTIYEGNTLRSIAMQRNIDNPTDFAIFKLMVDVIGDRSTARLAIGKEEVGNWQVVARYAKLSDDGESKISDVCTVVISKYDLKHNRKTE